MKLPTTRAQREEVRNILRKNTRGKSLSIATELTLVKYVCEAIEEWNDTLMSCPECGSDDFTTWNYDFGEDRETGYRDCGVRARCSSCQHQADVEDFQPQKKRV